jgi:hypothetical protein
MERQERVAKLIPFCILFIIAGLFIGLGLMEISWANELSSLNVAIYWHETLAHRLNLGYIFLIIGFGLLILAFSLLLIFGEYIWVNTDLESQTA